MRWWRGAESSLENVTGSDVGVLLPLDGSFEGLTADDEMVLPLPTPPVSPQLTEEAGGLISVGKESEQRGRDE